MHDSYESIAAALEAQGVRTHRQGPDQLVLSYQVGPVWPDRSNSFWLSRQRSQWLIATWLNICYWVPPDANITELCVECMQSSNVVMYRVPATLVQEYGLRELTDAEFEECFGPIDEWTTDEEAS